MREQRTEERSESLSGSSHSKRERCCGSSCEENKGSGKRSGCLGRGGERNALAIGGGTKTESSASESESASKEERTHRNKSERTKGGSLRQATREDLILRHRALASSAAHSAAIAREMPPARSLDQVFKVRAKPISDQRRLTGKRH